MSASILTTPLLQANGSTGSHAAEIIGMLLGAFLLGYLLRHFLNEKFKRRIRELEGEVSMLKNKITALEATNMQLNNDLDNAITRTIHLGNDLTHTTEKLKASDEANTKLTIELHAGKEKIEQQHEQIAAMKTNIGELEGSAVKMTEEIKKHMADIKDLKTKLASLKDSTSPS